jgi:hypothetical protein
MIRYRKEKCGWGSRRDKILKQNGKRGVKQKEVETKILKEKKGRGGTQRKALKKKGMN